MTNSSISENFRVKKCVSKTTNVVWIIFRTLLLIGLSFIILYPLIYMVSMTFRPQDEIFDPSVIWVPKGFTFENLITTAKLMKYPSALSLSLQLNIVSSILQLAICALTGYGFARFEFPFKKIFFALAVFTIFIPSQLVAIPLFMQFKNFDFFGVGSLAGLFTGVPLTVNLIDSRLTYYLPAIFGAGIKSGLFIFIYRQFFKGLPKELEDASAIDGCGFFSCFIKIMVPNAMVAFVTVFLLSTVWYWNDYYTASMFMRNVNTVSTSLANLSTTIAAYSGDISVDPYKTVIYLQAGCLLFILPVLVMYIFLQRFFIQGVERSGIVG